jgi:hypothetical protein
MIFSNNGKSYDDSDGSEHPHAASAERRQRTEREEINRWEDDGPGPHTRASAPATERKPAWSVLSLRNLLEAVRRLGRADDVAGAGDQSAAAERDLHAAEQRRQEAHAASAADRAFSERYRNHWENT